MYLQVMPPQETTTLMMDVEYILIISVLMITAIFIVDRIRRKWANR